MRKKVIYHAGAFPEEGSGYQGTFLLSRVIALTALGCEVVVLSVVHGPYDSSGRIGRLLRRVEDIIAGPKVINKNVALSNGKFFARRTVYLPRWRFPKLSSPDKRLKKVIDPDFFGTCSFSLACTGCLTLGRDA